MDAYEASLRRVEATLRRELRKLDGELDDKADTWQVEELQQKLDEESRELTDIKQQLEGQEENVEELGRELRAEITKATDTLDRRLRWLERHVRASAGAVTATFDPDPELRALAHRAERGQTLEKQLLDQYDRNAKTYTVQAWQTWTTDWRTQSAAALAASRRIAGTTPDSADRHNAVTAFHAARAELSVLNERRERVHTAATQAQERLTRDDAQRKASTTEIEQGQQAWAALTTRLRTRLADAIDKGHLLPVWFATVLGMSPPAEAAPWLQTGTELLAYRTTYGITDPVVALGPKPSTDSSSRRRTWHTQLAAKLARYR